MKRSLPLLFVFVLSWLSGAFSPAQGILSTFHTGEGLLQVGQGEKVSGDLWTKVQDVVPGLRVRLAVGNRGRPNIVPGARPGGGSIVPIHSVLIGVPAGWQIEFASELLCADLGIDFNGLRVWAAVSDAQPRGPDPRRPGDPLLPVPWALQSGSAQVLVGGEQRWWDLVPSAAPAPGQPRELPPALTSQEATDAAELLLLTPPLQGQDPYPRLTQMRRLMRGSPHSKIYNAPAGEADLEWFMRHGIRYKYSWIRTFPAFGADWGDIFWGSGHSGHDYDPERLVVEQYLRTGDPKVWDLAYLLARYKAQQCFYDCSSPNPVRHRWAYEKSATPFSKVGDDRWSEASHEWDTGFVMIAHMSGDADLLRIAHLRGEQILAMKAPEIWNRYWGPRFCMWHLENLLVHFVFTGDERFAESAKQKIGAWYGMLKPGELVWPEDGDPQILCYPWMDAYLCAIMLTWNSYVPGTLSPQQIDQRLRPMAAEVVRVGTRFVDTPQGRALQVAIAKGKPGHENRDNWQSPSTTGFFLPMLWAAAKYDPAKYQPYLDAARVSVGKCNWELWSNISSAPVPSPIEAEWRNSSYGSAIHKTIFQNLLFAKDVYMYH